MPHHAAQKKADGLFDDSIDGLYSPLSRSTNIELAEKPGQPEVAVKVFVTLLIKDLSDLDIIHGTFFCMMGVKLSWVDERMIGYNDEIPSNLWCPMFALPNAPDVSSRQLFEGSRGVVLVDDAVGLLSFQKNISARFLSSFDIREFPFDEYSMNIRFNSSCLRDGRDATTFGRGCKKQGAQFHLIAGITPEQCPGAKSRQAFVIRDKSLGSHLPEHTVLGIQHYEFVKKGVNTCSFISWGVCVRRQANYYFYKVVLLLWLTTLLAFCSFSVPVFAVADRLELVFNIFIATMATLYTVNEALPKSAFLHRVDRLVLACLFMVGLVCAETCLVSIICTDEEGSFACDATDARRVDQLFAYCAMGVYVVYNAHLFLRKLCVLATTPDDARPWWLPEHKVYTPLAKVFAIDIWQDTIMQKTSSDGGISAERQPGYLCSPLKQHVVEEAKAKNKKKLVRANQVGPADDVLQDVTEPVSESLSSSPATCSTAVPSPSLSTSPVEGSVSVNATVICNLRD
eukprot:g744.t1